MVMNYKYLKKSASMWITVFVFITAGAGSYAQQPAAEAEVIFQVA